MQIRTGERGFTLIEVITVAVIILLISAVVLAQLNEARKKSRDAQRKSDLAQLEQALEAYRQTNGEYPRPNAGCWAGETKFHGWVDEAGWAPWYVKCNKAAGEEYIEGLVPTYIHELPTEPHSTWDPVGYQYRVSADGQSYMVWAYYGAESETIESFEHPFARCPASCDGVNSWCTPDHDDFKYSYVIKAGPDSACW